MAFITIAPRGSHVCSNCGAKLNVYSDEKYFLSCYKCYNSFKYDTQKLSFVDAKFKSNFDRIKPKIALHKEGKINGVLYKVIGISRLKERDTAEYWTEYLLISERGETVVISNFETVWFIVRQIGSYNLGQQKKLHHFTDKINGRLQKFSVYYSVLTESVGEIPYDLMLRSQSKTYEWLGSNAMYIEEYDQKSNSKIDFKAEFIDANVIKKEFASAYINTSNDNHPLRDNSGVSFTFFGSFIAIIALLTILLQGYFWQGANERVIFNNVYPTSSTNFPIKEIVTDAFEVNGGNLDNELNTLEVELITSLSNQWLDLYITMINVTTGETYTVNESMEYYSGYDGGSWSEGSNHTTILLPRMKKGTYRMVIEPFTPNFSESTIGSLVIGPSKEVSELGKHVLATSMDGKFSIMEGDSISEQAKVDETFDTAIDFEVKVKESVTFSLNFILMLLVLAIVFGVYIYRLSLRKDSKWYLSNIRNKP